jgi:SAM-dependent methyltransferase/uncharacterized protein YbaR (Trm112 family)
MRRRLLRWLCCPLCRGTLSLQVMREHEEMLPPPPEHPFWSGQATDSYTTALRDTAWLREVDEGLLSCDCGAVYPIWGGIPRLYDGAIRDVPATFVARPLPPAPGRHKRTRVLSTRTQECYSYLWAFKAEHMGWAYRPEGEKEFFLQHMGLSETDLPGKTLLDAGCGDGRLTAFLATLGLETIGIDLSRGVEIGYAHNRSALVHYVQGDLLQPPFRASSFDYVWSFGVLHHTRNPKLAFHGCAEMLRPHGRLFVWLYDKAPKRRAWLIRAVQRAPMPVKMLVSQVCTIGNRIKRTLGGGNPVTLSQAGDEVYFWNMDMYGPEFRFLHTLPEVEGWLKELGFAHITHRGRMEFGFGLTADRVAHTEAL